MDTCELLNSQQFQQLHSTYSSLWLIVHLNWHHHAYKVQIILQLQSIILIERYSNRLSLLIFFTKKLKKFRKPEKLLRCNVIMLWRDYDLAFYTTYVVCVKFIYGRRDLQFEVITIDGIMISAFFRSSIRDYLEFIE